MQLNQVQARLEKDLIAMNEWFKTDFIYVKTLQDLYCGSIGHEDLICSLIDLQDYHVKDDCLVLDFSDDCPVYLFVDGTFEFEGDSKRSTGGVPNAATREETATSET